MADFPSNQRLFIPRPSDVSIQAKRESAKKSIGPKIPPRQRSSPRTVLKHRMFSSQIVFAHEDPDRSVLADKRILCTWRIAEAGCD